ncbi:MAG: flagellar biosynthesis protein FliQ [Ignavibacteria bacterium]|nr:flagellar biosynthesis protein FliQ [Ignavibacteria bacterium]
MSEEFVISLARDFFWTTILVGGPALVVSLVIGLLISVFQAATSIQEYTLTFVPKLIGIAIVMFFTLPWMLQVLITFTTNLFLKIPDLAR